MTVVVLDRPIVRRWWAVAALTAALGLLIAGAAALHILAVIGVAYTERHGYDGRLGLLLWIGWTTLVCGLVMVAAAPSVVRAAGRRTGLLVAGRAAAVFAVASALQTPNSPGFLIAVALYGSYAVVTGLLALCRARTVPGRPDRRPADQLPASPEFG